MCITDEILWKAAKDVYRPDYNKLEKFIDKPTQAEGYYVDSTSNLSGNHASYESHGLQASLIKVNGQYVVAARGTANEGQDFVADYDLTDPDAYKKPSQFKDFDRFIEKMQKLHPDFDPHKAVYTGHSLGGALASQAAVHYDAQASVFSAPSAYNQLNPMERAKLWLGIYQTKIKNSKHPNDAIPNLPGMAVPSVGRQVFTPNYKSDPTKFAQIKDRKTAALYQMFGIEGHSTNTMDEKNFSHDQSVAEMPFLSGIHQNTYANLTSAGVVLYTARSAWSLVRNIPKVKSSLETSRAILEKEVPIALKVAETGKVALEKSSVNIAIASLESTEAPLKEIKKINNSLYPEMQKKFEKITQMAGDLPYISASDVANVVAEYQLEPQHHIDLTEVEAANQLVDQNLEKVDQIITGLKTAAEHIEQDDQEWSVKFSSN